MTKKDSVEYGRADLAEKIQEATGCANIDAIKQVRNVLNAIFQCLTAGQKHHEEVRVKLSCFGSFRTLRTNPRKGQNPKTGEDADVPESVRVLFSSSSTLKRGLRDSLR